MTINLDLLPSELVALISSFLNGYELVLLYLSGNAAINRTLSSYSKYFVLKSHNFQNLATALWPNNSLHRFSALVHVEIHPDSSNHIFTSTTILSLPKTLETLISTSNRSLDAFLVQQNQLTFQFDPRAYPLCKPSLVFSHSVLDVGRKFPALKILRLARSNDSTSSAIWSVEGVVIPFLLSMPPSLTELDFGQKTTLHIPYLPKNLVTASLVLRASETSGVHQNMLEPQKIFKQLPIHPKRMSLFITGCLSNNTFKYLPNSITDMHLAVSFGQFDDDYLMHLPHSITNLKLLLAGSSIKQGTFRYLPTNLKSLRVHSKIDPPFASTMFRELPRNLTSLYLYLVKAVPEYHPDFSDLPKTLKKLRIHFDEYFNLKGISTLESLEHLDLTVIPSNGISDDHIKLLPQSLTRLDITASNVSSTLSDEGIASLPRELKSLSLSFSSRFITSSGFKYLPPGLTELKVGKITKIGDSTVADLPCCLLSMSWIPSGVFVSRQDICNLPHTLTYLDLNRSTLHVDDVRLLPPTLKTLHVTDSSLIDETVKYLPRSLTVLTLNQNARITDEGCLDFPPHLKSLLLRDNPNISILGISRLPKSITQLSLRHVNPLTPLPFENPLHALLQIPSNMVITLTNPQSKGGRENWRTLVKAAIADYQAKS